MAETQEEETIVYLEDLESQSTIPSTQSQSGGSVATTSSQTSTVAVSNKRQRTLMDMFSGSQPKATSAPSAKKLKLSVSEPALPGKRSMTSASQSQRLNAIPFSSSQFQESLSEEQRRLLALECAYMGKSWCVAVIGSSVLYN
jgi:uracil-DNA glycosylase